MQEKVLVIHPADPTTDFLSEIYDGKGWDVISYDMSGSDLKAIMSGYDKIIFLGHGCPHGLFGHGKLFIDSSFVYILKHIECVYIWCNADQFVHRYKLKGFYTGMIISEIDEAYMFNIYPTKDEIDFSNKLFASSIKKSFKASDVLLEYNDSTSEVIKFNSARIYST